MDLLVALALVVLAWVVFKSLTAVLVVLACAALVVWIVRNSGTPRL